MHKVRVAHVIETMHTGGAEAVVANLLNHLSPAYKPILVCVKESGPSVHHIRRNDVEIIEMGKTGGNDPRIPFRLAQILSERNVSVLHIHNWNVFIEGVLAGVLARVPACIHTAHGDFRGYPHGTANRIKRILRHRVESLLSGGVGKFVAVSEDIKRRVCEVLHLDPEKVSVVKNGVEIPMDEPARDGGFSRTFPGTNGHSLVAVGRLVEVKNLPMLLLAVSRIDRSVPIRLLLVGDGPERSNLQKMTGALGITDRVMFLGHRSDVRGILKEASVFVSASSFEGVSIAMLEAMASGLPVVATRVGGTPEVVADGISGFLVAPGDPDAMAERIGIILGDKELRLRMGMQGRRIVQEMYSTERMVRNYESIYRELLELS